MVVEGVEEEEEKDETVFVSKLLQLLLFCWNCCCCCFCNWSLALDTSSADIPCVDLLVSLTLFAWAFLCVSVCVSVGGVGCTSPDDAEEAPDGDVGITNATGNIINCWKGRKEE